MRISKSRFMVLVDNQTHFWAAMHDQMPDAGSAMQEYLAIQGYRAEELAERYLRDHVLPTYAHAEVREQVECMHQAFFARIDAVIYDADAQVYDLYEIKSGTRPEQYVYDIAFQREVFRQQFRVRHSYIVHLNAAYVRRGDLDIGQLFQRTAMDVAIDRILPDVHALQAQAVQIAAALTPHGLTPCTSPKTCPCPTLCHANLPAYSIYDIPYLDAAHRQTLRQANVVDIHDVRDMTPFSANQQLHIRAMQSGQPHIDREAVRQALAQLTYPIAFLDYEAARQAIPLDGFAPNQDAAFQYALYVVEKLGAQPQAYAHLADGQGDYVRGLIEQLLHDMPRHGSVVVWNETYERGINQNMASAYPQFASDLAAMNARIVDLADVFKQNAYVDPRCKGSWSIKAVLPVLVPQLNYNELVIGDGGSAVLAWNRSIDTQTTTVERAAIRQALLTYCGQDALAMLEIWRVLVRV